MLHLERKVCSSFAGVNKKTTPSERNLSMCFVIIGYLQG